MLALLRGSNALMRQRQRELQRQVAERTAQLSASQDELQRTNALLEARVADRTRALAERTKALELSEARFRAWFSHAEDGVFVVGLKPDGRFVIEEANAAVGRLYGVSRAKLAGREPGEIFLPQAAARIEKRLRQAAESGPVRFETRLALKGGERILETWIVAVRDPVTGRVARLIGATRDTTERRVLEGRLAQAQKLQALGGWPAASRTTSTTSCRRLPVRRC